MARPRNPNAKPNVGLVKRKQKDGSYLVFEKTSVYDPIKKNSKTIKEVRIGRLPADYTDEVKDLIPWVPKRKTKTPKAVETAATTVLDPREQAKVKYPLAESLMAIFFAVLCGCNTCLQIEAFWKSNLKKLRALLPKLPDVSISHDTIRRFVQLLGRDNEQKFFRHITDPLVRQFRSRRVAIDGQAVRASSVDAQKQTYIFNAFDSDNGLVLNQVLIKAKENEISQSIELLTDLDLTGCVVTADALNTQRKLVSFLINEKSCDYCLALKGNQGNLFDLVKVLFSDAHLPKHELAQWESKIANTANRGHGRDERRKLRVLPARLLGADVCDAWSGLFYGTIVEATTEAVDLKTGEVSSQVRYFISSLNFDERYIAEKMAHVIRGHWAIENQLHWSLDVCFNQDRICCRNADFIKGITQLNKLAINIQNKVLEGLKEQSRRTITRPMLMREMADIERSVELMATAYEELESTDRTTSHA